MFKKPKRTIHLQLKTKKFKPVIDPRIKYNVLPGTVRLEKEETESIRLVDYKGLQQKEAAKKMNTSQSTVQRMLAKGRKKVADALINAKTIEL